MSLLWNEECMLITACLLPGLALEKKKTQQNKDLLALREAHQKMHHCQRAGRVLVDVGLEFCSLPLLTNPSIKYLRQPLPA